MKSEYSNLLEYSMYAMSTFNTSILHMVKSFLLSCYNLNDTSTLCNTITKSGCIKMQYHYFNLDLNLMQAMQ